MRREFEEVLTTGPGCLWFRLDGDRAGLDSERRIGDVRAMVHGKDQQARKAAKVQILKKFKK